MKKIYSNFLNSINGLREVLKENSFILEIIGGLFLIPFLIIVETDSLIKLLIIVIYFILLAFEIINTSIEKISDKIKNDFDLDIKIIKDMSSAVFIVLLILIFSNFKHYKFLDNENLINFYTIIISALILFI